jgi:hypothetical protein
VRTAGEVAFFEPDVAEHALHQIDMLGLAAVGRAGNGKLLVAPLECIEPAGGKKGQNLERLCAGSPEGERVRIARRAYELIALAYYGSVYSMLGFNSFAARDYDIELERFCHTSRHSRWVPRIA